MLTKLVAFSLVASMSWPVSLVALAQTSTRDSAPTSGFPTTPPGVQCPVNCACDSAGKILYCEEIYIDHPSKPVTPYVPQPSEPGPEPTPLPQPKAKRLPVPQQSAFAPPTGYPNSQWNTSLPITIEVTATKTAISALPSVASELRADCSKEGGTVTCPTSEEKQIIVPVMTAGTENPVEAVTIQKQADGAIGIMSRGVTATTTEKVVVENNHLFVGSSDNTESVNVLPNVAKDNATVSARLTHITTTELKVEEQHPVYTIQGTRAAKLLFFIPVSVKTVAKINATSGGVVSIQKPWWSFLAR